MEAGSFGGIRTGDVVTLSCYLACTLGVGLWFGIRTKSTVGYFLGGRSMPGWAVGISMLGTAISSVTFLAYPGSAYDGNFSRVVPGMALPMGAMVGLIVFVPFYRKTGFISAYTYFERRYGLWARVYVCSIFSLGQLWRMGMILYLLSMAVVGMHSNWNLHTVIVVIGIFVTVYTVLGGIEAVIWTDVFQTITLILGGLAVIVIVFLSVDGGAATVFSMGAANGKFSFMGKNVESIFDLSFARDTAFMLIITGAVGSMQEFAIDQTKVQRYCAASTTAGARRATLIGGFGCIPVWLLFMFAGTCLWVFYQSHASRLPNEILADQVFPHFILHELPIGLGGIVLAGVLAAAMSSIDSSMSGVTTSITEDVYKRVLVPGRSDTFYLKSAKAIASSSGVLMVLVALGLTFLRQEAVLDLAYVVGAILAGGVGGLFLIGFCSTRTNNFGAVIGIVLALLSTFIMTGIEAKSRIWESNVNWRIERAIETGEVDALAIREDIRNKASARGEVMGLASVLSEEKKAIQNLIAPQIQAELGPKPPNMGEAIGIHAFMMGIIINLFAILGGYFCSYLRPPPPIQNLAGMTWRMRDRKRVEL